MLKIIAKSLLELLGWRIDIKLPEEKKFVLIGAPHTSNWDFPIALLTFWTLDLKIKWVGKSQMFRGPLHYLFTALGGIPVERNSSQGFIEQISDRIIQSDKMVLTIAPEGTRSKTLYWKSGFYHIALAANIPICMGYIDYQKKIIGFGKLLYPTGNIETDIKIIADFYSKIKGKHPSNQGPTRIKPTQKTTAHIESVKNRPSQK